MERMKNIFENIEEELKETNNKTEFLNNIYIELLEFLMDECNKGNCLHNDFILRLESDKLTLFRDFMEYDK